MIFDGSDSDISDIFVHTKQKTDFLAAQNLFVLASGQQK
jgi:hypothetical protein